MSNSKGWDEYRCGECVDADGRQLSFGTGRPAEVAMWRHRAQVHPIVPLKQDQCLIPPKGWWCSREPGHDGPCAARPTMFRQGWCQCWFHRLIQRLVGLRS